MTREIDGDYHIMGEYMGNGASLETTVPHLSELAETHFHVPFEAWQLLQLQRIAATEPERMSALFDALWDRFPDLYEELVISAVDQEILSVCEAADKLGVSPCTIDAKLISYRQEHHSSLIVVSEDEPARLSESSVAVWEVVREYRKHRSIEKIHQSFPMLSVSEIEAALRYWEGNSGEVEGQIARFAEVRSEPSVASQTR